MFGLSQKAQPWTQPKSEVTQCVHCSRLEHFVLIFLEHDNTNHLVLLLLLLSIFLFIHQFLGSITESGSACYDMLTWRGLFICMLSVTLVQSAKANGWHEMPFDRDTHMVPCNIAPVPPWEGEILGSEPPVRSDAAYFQITLALKLLQVRTGSRSR